MSTSLLLIPVAIIYLLVVGSLYVYGINFYYLTFVAFTKGQTHHQATPTVTNWPAVTVQLPIYNEPYVARRVIEAAAAMDYPADCLEIQVLDDSTDETIAIIAQVVLELHKSGTNIHHVRRAERDGFKAGALRDGLRTASGAFIAIFDADFIPSPTFLKRTVPYFNDHKIAFVQGRWDHINRDYSPLTYFQSLAIDGHFMIEQFGRSQGGYWFNFNGTAGIWRKAAIEEAGGWQPRTLTEDLDLSYRAFLNGWHAVFVRNLNIPAEIPLTFSSYRRQQGRWARGSLENAAILIPKIWRSEFPFKLKVEATLHLTGYVVHLLLFALSVIYPLVLILSGQFPSLVSLFGLALIFNITALAPTLSFIVAQAQLKRPWWQMIPAIVFISVFGTGMMLNTVRAALEALRKTDRQFQRTPKFGVTSKGQSWRRSVYKLKLDPIVFWEIAFGLMNVVTCILAIQVQHWFIAFYTMIFATGLFFNSSYTLYQSVYDRR